MGEKEKERAASGWRMSLSLSLICLYGVLDRGVVQPSCRGNRQGRLPNLDGPCVLLLLFLGHLRQGNGEYAVLNLGLDALAVHIFGQRIGLLVVAVGEFAAQIVLLLVLLLVFALVLYGQAQVALLVHIDTATILLNARRCHFHYIGFLILLDIDCGCRAIGARHEISVQEIVKYCWEPTVVKHYW